MKRRVGIRIGGNELTAELSDTSTSAAIFSALPLEFEMERWGDEYYGDCGIALPESENSRVVMKVGEVAYWPVGRALCIFFGRTPVSIDDTPRAASAVNPVGHILGDCSALKKLGSSVTARFSRM